MGKKSSTPPPSPDYTGIQGDISDWMSTVSDRSAELQDWWMGEYEDLSAKADSVFNFSWETAEELRDWAASDRERYQNVFIPLQDEIIEQARNWASDEEIGRVRGEAVADAGVAFEAARENSLRELEGYGIDPSSTRHQALDVGVRSQEAIAKAFGANNAARQRELEAVALQQGAAQMGAGLPEQASRNDIASANVNSQALSGAGMTAGTGIQGANMTLPYYGMEGTGLGMQADIMSQDYRNRLAAYELEQAGGGDLGGIGSLAGGVIGGIYGGPGGAAAGSAIGGAAGSMITYADGGEVMKYADGGGAPGGRRMEGAEHGVFTGDRDGGETADKIPAYLSENEFVIPADVVKRKGTEFFDGLIEKTRGGGSSSKSKDNKLAGGGTPNPAQGIPALPGPISPMPPRVQTGTAMVPSAGNSPVAMPTAHYQFDAALDALSRKYGVNAGGVG